ncbi:hypothetical protein OKW21_000297 [Catalinimonas alkaloidigena]|uniref:hypothetical protein n=1 Tax=Catalinimonas alkaloidigena TaxID=1075417 RepID=UPI0024064947|nr:hypothetical protein [Catalinimonas alkaloidigena]MDF9795034.1 hypothetical protein [Catalinimonas alkaloidigena]
MMRQLLIILLIAISPSLHAQHLNRNWKSELESSLSKFMACEESESTPACHNFAGESLQTVYRINDFYSSEKGMFLEPHEIYEFLDKSDQWTLLGKGYDQNALNNAQQYANGNKAVVAVMKGETYGHMVLILPGELQTSGSWSLKVPNSASFFTHQTDKSYVNKKLSYAFTPSDQGHVLLYGRKY